MEDFDASLVSLQRETGLRTRRAVISGRRKGALNKPRHLTEETRRASSRRNELDEIFYAAAQEVHAWKRCCYGVDDEAVAAFRAKNLEFQHSTGCHVIHDRKQKCLDNRDEPATELARPRHDQHGAKCAALDPRKYALPGDSDQRRPKEDWCPPSSKLVDGALRASCYWWWQWILLFFCRVPWRNVGWCG